MGRILGVGLSSVAAAPLAEGRHGGEDVEGTPVWVLYVASMALVLLGGAFAGLTIAYVCMPFFSLPLFSFSPLFPPFLFFFFSVHMFCSTSFPGHRLSMIGDINPRNRRCAIR